MITEKGPMNFLLWGIYTERIYIHIYPYTYVHIKIFFKEMITFIQKGCIKLIKSDGKERHV